MTHNISSSAKALKVAEAFEKLREEYEEEKRPHEAKRVEAALNEIINRDESLERLYDILIETGSVK